MKILVTGANGQLASEIQAVALKYNEFDLLFKTKKELNIGNANAVEEIVTSHKIDAIINTAAYTNVEQAEDEEEKALKINAEAVKNLAEIAKKHQLKLVHISTDYVFDGAEKRPYVETDFKHPLNVYGSSKANGEEALLKVNPPNAIIIRTSWLYSSFGNNFVKTMVRLLTSKKRITVIADQTGAPTYARDLANVILSILPKIDSSSTEIYNYSNSGSCTWYLFATKIKSLLQSTCQIETTTSEAYKTKAERPKYSVLNTQKIKETFHLEIPLWENSLEKCIYKIKHK